MPEMREGERKHIVPNPPLPDSRFDTAFCPCTLVEIFD